MQNVDKKTSKWKLVIVILLIFVVLVVGIWGILKTKNDAIKRNLFIKTTNVNSKIGISYSLLGTTQRQIPDVKDEGLSRYPIYGQTLTRLEEESAEDFSDFKKNMLSENAYLNSTSNALLQGDCDNYNSMDSRGYLYLDGNAVNDKNGVHRKLYKHTASIGMYYGDVSDQEPAVIKQIEIQPRNMGNYITGLYAPAGEVIKLTISAKDLNAIESFYIYVGATLANGDANNIWESRDFVRMPVIANKMPVNTTVCSYDSNSQTYTCYFGSYLGDPIYIGTSTQRKQFKVEISGAVEYPHFIYGLTTKEEYERLRKTSTPYFDLEIFDNAVRFSGTSKYAIKYSFEDLYQSADLWDKIAMVSKQVPTGSNSLYGIDFLFEPFVAAGGAVAFVGRNTVNCPTDWMDACLNFEQFIYDGEWGSIHEFNHHFQGYGLADHGEVTNNAISLVEYSLFTKVSARRSLDDNTLMGWNRFTDPSRASRELFEDPAEEPVVWSLAGYATVLHSFGQSVFIKATQNGSGADNWYKNLCNLTHYDFYYYFNEILHETVSSEVVEEIKKCNYPMYVPVSCIYQTGTKYDFDGQTRHITTVQSFEFFGDYYDFNIKPLIHLPEGFTIDSIAVSNPQYGEIINLAEDQYRFIPSHQKISGDIDVTIKISKDDGAFNVKDVVLVFGFKQDQKRIAERTTFYFDQDIDTLFDDVDDAVKKNYAGYLTSENYDSTFNGNECAAVWWNSAGVEQNSITEYNSKIYISEDNLYRFSIRGKNSNLYISLDGVSYELVAQADEKYNNNFSVSVKNGEYKDYQLKRGQVVYIKAVALHNIVNFEGSSFVVGMGSVQNETANLSDITNKTTVYNNNYQKESFKTDYFYNREYAISELKIETNNASKIVETNFTPWDSTTVIENLFDGDFSTFMHNEQYKYINESNQFEIVVDLGRPINANKFIMYGRSYNTQTPMSFKLLGGIDKDNLSLLCEYSNEPLKNKYNQIATFNLTQLRYYKLVVTKTNANYICLSEVEFCIDFSNGKLVSPDDENINYYGKWALNYDLSTFGHSYVTSLGHLEYDFTGTQFAVISKTGKPSKFSVSIDGGKEIDVEFDGIGDLMFVSEIIQETHHKVTIKATSEIDIVAFATR